MAADVISDAGHRVTVVDHKPSFGRKFLMAGKSDLNLTKAEDQSHFEQSFIEGASFLSPILRACGPKEVMEWAADLDQEIFTGSSGRVFPKSMKASPILRAWLARLAEKGVKMRARTRWHGWDGEACVLDSPEGQTTIKPDATVLALGGGSWARLGSDAAWVPILRDAGIPITPMLPSNAALRIDWSTHMTAHFGSALKNISLSSGAYTSRGEAILAERGIEGGGAYSVSAGIRAGHDLTIDLLPDLNASQIAARLVAAKPKDSLTNKLRKTLNLPKVKTALLREAHPDLSSDPTTLAQQIKTVRFQAELAPIDDAISTSGGISQDALTADLMLRARPGVFAAGEMLDWDAPTGGYLITACLATGRHAGKGVVSWLEAG